MARGRLISKSLGSSRKYHALLAAGGKLGEFCQVLYPLLVANADECGRMPGDAFTVKNLMLPTSPRPEKDFEQALCVISGSGLIARYAVDADIFVEITDFESHQHLNLKHRGESRYPAQSQGVAVTPQNSAELRRAPQNSALSLSLSLSGSLSQSCARADESDQLFAQFWAAYPKKKAKEDAQRAWKKLSLNSELLAVILRAVEHQRHSPDWQKDSGRYIPLPASWLNGARWTDVVDVEVDEQPTLGRANTRLAAAVANIKRSETG